MKSISVIIPSRKQPKQISFLNNAIKSVEQQIVGHTHKINIIICLDKGQHHITLKKTDLPIQFAESKECSQASALNAGIRASNSDYISFLEDDDDWNPLFLQNSLNALSHADIGFTSSTQLEHDENNTIIRINDFPTPSSWFMTAETLATVGDFDEEYKFHLDNDWLGRLSEHKIQRVHLIESTAPVHPAHFKQIRPWLHNVSIQSGGLVKYIRHLEPYPLVNRLVHSNSGMAQISLNPELKTISQKEHQRLISRFKKVPW